MLAKPNRVVRADEFRTTMRKGRRVTTRHAVVYLNDRAPLADTSPQPSRFGFVISKAVGNSVARNLLRRRLRAIGQEFVVDGVHSKDIVVRALPGSGQLDWASLHSEIATAVGKGTGR